MANSVDVSKEVNLLVHLARQCESDSGKWFPGAGGSLAHHVLALCGEVGELANIVKKVERGSLTIDSEIVMLDIESELADVFTYLLNIAALRNIDLFKAYLKKRDYNVKRFGGNGTR